VIVAVMGFNAFKIILAEIGIIEFDHWPLLSCEMSRVQEKNQ